MKIEISVCEICQRANCEGKVYETEELSGAYGFRIGKKRICSGDPNLIQTKDGLRYRVVSGHGHAGLFKVKEAG